MLGIDTQQTLHLVMAGRGLGQLSPATAQFRTELGELLGRQYSTADGGEAGVAAELLELTISGQEPLLGFVHLALQPNGGLTDDLGPGHALRLEIKIDGGVGGAGGELWIGGDILYFDNPAVAPGLDGKAAEIAADDLDRQVFNIDLVKGDGIGCGDVQAKYFGYTPGVQQGLHLLPITGKTGQGYFG